MNIERNIEFILEQMAALTTGLTELRERQLDAEERHDREMADIRGELRRAIRFSVEEHRRERVRRQELEAAFDDRVTKMAATILAHDEDLKTLKQSIQRFLDSSQRGGNGHPPA
jgi:hypothetical protein